MQEGSLRTGDGNNKKSGQEKQGRENQHRRVKQRHRNEEKGQWGSGDGCYALGKMKLCFRADKKLRSSGRLKGGKSSKDCLLGDGVKKVGL